MKPVLYHQLALLAADYPTFGLGIVSTELYFKIALLQETTCTYQSTPMFFIHDRFFPKIIRTHKTCVTRSNQQQDC